MKPAEQSAARFEELVLPCEDGPTIYIHIDNEPTMLVNPNGVELLELIMKPSEQFASHTAAFVDAYRNKLEHLRKVIADNFHLERPCTHFYATAGEVVLEWDAGDWNVSLEISIDSDMLSAAFYALNNQTDEEEGRGLHMARKEDWAWLEKWLREKQESEDLSILECLEYE